MTLVAPPVGGMLRIVKMMPTGVPVKKGDVDHRVRPCRSAVRARAGEVRVAEAEQEIAKMKADAAVQTAQDEVGAADRAVRRSGAAELDALGNELIARDRGAEERADARRGEAARWSSSNRTSSRAPTTNTASLAVAAGEAQQGDARDAARAAGHRQPGDQGADRRRGLGQGEPRRHGRLR